MALSEPTVALRPQARSRSDFKLFRPIQTRWMDNDVYGHVNNVVYYSYFDTAVNAYLIEAGALDIHHGEVIGLVVETQCNYFEPLGFPQNVDAGLRVARTGGSSVRYEIGLFAEGAPLSAAAGHFVHVYVNRQTRRPEPLPAALRAALAPLLLPLLYLLLDKLFMTAHAPQDRSVDAAQTAAVDAALTSRRSIRAYLPTPVPREELEALLAVAARAPSGTNTQPWQVHVLTGAPLAALTQRIEAAYLDPDERGTHTEEYTYYPTEWRSPYIDRRRKVGWDLYSLLGITKDDKARMQAQHARNYRFFDAPVGLIFTIDRVMQQGSWLDYGMFVQSVMVAARARGLDTCPQAAFTQFHRVIEEALALPAEQMVVCGMALGYADPNAVENTLVTAREPVSGFARFWG